LIKNQLNKGLKQQIIFCAEKKPVATINFAGTGSKKSLY